MIIAHDRRGISTLAAVAIVVVIVALAAVVVLAYPSLTGMTNSNNIQTVNVIMPAGVSANQSLSFEPKTITVVIGVNNTIKWTNDDSTAHTVVSTSVPSGAQSFGSSSALIQPGGTFTVTLTVAGTYQYHCSIHPSNMMGTIVVKQ